MTASIIDSSSPSSPVPQSDSIPFKRRLLKLTVILNLVTIVFVCAALVVKSFLADSVPYISTFYYATPLPLLTGLAVLAALVNIYLRHRHYFVVWSFAAATLISWTGFETVEAASSKPVEHANYQSIKVAFWNVGRGVGGWPKIIAEMRSWNADVIGIVESGTNEGNEREFWQEHFPEHDVSMLGGEFVLLVKGTSGECSPGKFGPLGKFREISVNVDGSDFDVILIDISSAPFVFRESTLIAMADVMNNKTDRPTLLMGDFNTPTNSVHFEGLRKKWINAFEHVGQGYAPTWPVPAPMLVLDQIWYNDRIKPTRCELEWSTASDHRPVLVEVNPLN